MGDVGNGGRAAEEPGELGDPEAGEKSLREVKERLAALALALGMTVTDLRTRGLCLEVVAARIAATARALKRSRTTIQCSLTGYPALRELKRTLTGSRRALAVRGRPQRDQRQPQDAGPLRAAFCLALAR
jgi:hypothetical protein